MKNGRPDPKPGDVVWHHEANESVVVAVVDDEANQLALTGPVEVWLPLDAVTVQQESVPAIHRRTLVEWAQDTGRRGVVARRALAIMWSDGKLGQ